MHGELIELNERLQKMLSMREHQLRRLREELVNLRGPVCDFLYFIFFIFYYLYHTFFFFHIFLFSLHSFLMIPVKMIRLV